MLCAGATVECKRNLSRNNNRYSAGERKYYDSQSTQEMYGGFDLIQRRAGYGQATKIEIHAEHCCNRTV